MTIRAHLEALERAGLIQATTAGIELEYLFRHGLIQDAAYSTLLRPQRQAWHRAAGEALEAQAAQPEAQGGEGLAPVLAQHFAVAGDDARACRYFVRAGDAAFERYALAEAGDYYSQALALVVNPKAPPDPARLRHVALRYGLTLELRSRFQEALRHYAAIEALAQQQEDTALELAAVMEQAKIHATANLAYDPERSRELLARAAPLAERSGEHAAQARLLWTLMLQNLMRGGDPDERRDYGEQALAIAQAHNLREQLAYIHQDLWFAYGGLLRWEATEATLQAARQLWTELHYPVGLCEVLGRLSIVAMVKGDYDQSLALADEAYQIAARIPSPDMQALSHAFAVLVHADRGDYALAIRSATAAVDLGQTTGNVTVLVGTRADLGLTYGELGHPARGLALAEAAHELGRTQFPLLAGWSGAIVARLHLLHGNVAAAAATLAGLERYKTYQQRSGFMVMMWTHMALAQAELALAQGQAAHAASLMAEVAETMVATGMRFRRPDVLYLRGAALLAQGRLAVARSALQAARLEALALASRRTHWRIVAALAEVETQSGQPEAAAHWRREARDDLARIAEHAPAELRASFLARPDVQALLQDDA